MATKFYVYIIVWYALISDNKQISLFLSLNLRKIIQISYIVCEIFNVEIVFFPNQTIEDLRLNLSLLSIVHMDSWKRAYLTKRIKYAFA